MAISLDRSHAGLVRGVQAEIQAKRVVVHTEAAPDADISLELYAANERKSLLEAVIDRRVELLPA